MQPGCTQGTQNNSFDRQNGRQAGTLVRWTDWHIQPKLQYDRVRGKRRNQMHNKIRTIVPGRGLGLHELTNASTQCDSFRFQLAFAKEQTENILSNLDELVENTKNKAPLRAYDFCLDRVTDPELTHEEDKWERAVYKKWGPAGSGEFVSVCKRIQTYQYPLQEHGKVNKCWGAIDLLGIGTNFLPIPNNLKKRRSRESSLRMLVEVAAYGFAICKVWLKLKDQGRARRAFSAISGDLGQDYFGVRRAGRILVSFPWVVV
jgi:hypothetical protein